MKLFVNKIVITLSIILIVMVGACNVFEAYADDTIVMQKLVGIWWTHDANDIPWALQFNADGSFRSAHTYLRLEKLPVDVGKFQLKGTSLTLISSKDCTGSCKGLKGTYQVGFSEYGQLLLKAQKDQCSERKEVCGRPWIKVLR
jgi:hypothetical protein